MTRAERRAAPEPARIPAAGRPMHPSGGGVDMTYKSNTLATWIALIGGSLGLHRFYLHGFRDPWGWLFAWPTLLGLYGVQRMRELGQDDQLAWALIPLLGAAKALAHFEEALAIKPGQGVSIPGEVRWHPVQDDAATTLMHEVHEVAKIIGAAEAL